MKSILRSCCLFLFVAACAHAQTGKMILARQSISPGGAGLSSSPTRTLHAALAEPVAGISRNATRVLYSGFLFPRMAAGQTVVQRLPLAPSGMRLHQNYPNPVTSVSGFRTSAVYEIDTPADVEVHVYDIAGRRVAIIASLTLPAGVYHAVFDLSALPAGTYILALHASVKGTVQVRSVPFQMLR